MTGKLEQENLIVRNLLKTKKYDIHEFVWGYLQIESSTACMCCGSFDFPIGRLILQTKDGEKVVLQYEGDEKPKALLAEISALNPKMVVGFTKENKEKFQQE